MQRIITGFGFDCTTIVSHPRAMDESPQPAGADASLRSSLRGLLAKTRAARFVRRLLRWAGGRECPEKRLRRTRQAGGPSHNSLRTSPPVEVPEVAFRRNPVAHALLQRADVREPAVALALPDELPIHPDLEDPPRSRAAAPPTRAPRRRSRAAPAPSTPPGAASCSGCNRRSSPAGLSAIRSSIAAAPGRLEPEDIPRPHLAPVGARRAPPPARPPARSASGRARPRPPPASPGGGTTRCPDRIATVIGARKRIRRSTPSPPRNRPAPPDPSRSRKASSTTGKRHSSTSGSVSREFVMCECTPLVPGCPRPSDSTPAPVPPQTVS